MLAAAEVPRIVHIGCEAASFARDIGPLPWPRLRRGRAGGVRLVPVDPPCRVCRRAAQVVDKAVTPPPSALRAFLLTLAVVDDLLAITVIAVFIHRAHQHRRAGGGAGAAGGVRAVRAARGAGVVAADPAGRGHLGADARVGRARHGGRCAVGVRGPGAALGDPAATRDGRAFRAPAAADLRGRRDTGVRILRGGRPGRRSGLARAFTDPITLGIVLGLVVGKPVGIFSSPGCWPRRRGPIWTPTCGGSMWWAFRCWRGSASRCPC